MEKLTNIRSLLEALSRAMNLINPEVTLTTRASC